MKALSIKEIQKNISVFNNLNEVIQVVDKRKNKILATVIPNKKTSITKELGGKYRKYSKNTDKDFKKIKEFALKEALREKYGISD